MTAVRTARVVPLGVRHACAVRAVRPDRATGTTTVESDCGAHLVPGLPDAVAGAVATSGLRRTSHLLIVVEGGTATCSVAGITRSPVRRPLSLGAALALADRGVRAFLVAEG